MATSFNNFRKTLQEGLGVLETYTYQDKCVVIGDNFDVTIDGQHINEQFESLEEARNYTRKYIETKNVLEDIDTEIPEERVAHYIRQYHSVEKITDTLVESYIELASSNLFTVDPVALAIKDRSVKEFSGKYEYNLADGNIVAINEDTQETLNRLLQDKPEIVDYMRESKDNFMRIIREI